MQRYRTPYLRSLLLLLFLTTAASAQNSMDCVQGEGWVSEEKSLPGEGLLTTFMDGVPYILHRMPGTTTGDNTHYGISKRNGGTWELVTSFQADPNTHSNTFLPDVIRSIKGHEGTLYIGGSFTSLNGDKNISHVAKWDGSSWTSMRGTFYLNWVVDMDIHEGALTVIAARRWPDEEGVNILRWAGSDWTYVGGKSAPIQKEGEKHTIVSWNGNLYVGGYQYRDKFTDSAIVTTVTRWNGDTWTPLLEPRVGQITKLFIYQGKLSAYGHFYAADSFYRPRILAWDGTAWDIEKIGLPDPELYVRDLGVNGDQLLITGNDFVTPHQKPAYNRIFEFDGESWNQISSTNGVIRTIFSDQGRLVVAGSFSGSCGTPLNNIAFMGAPMSVEREAAGSGLAIYPNPARGILTIDAELRAGAAVTLRTLLGETVRSYSHSGAGPATVDLHDLPAGTYLLTAETADGLRSQQVTVVR